MGDGEERQTPWSEASNTAELPRNYEILAGPVYKPKSEFKEVQATVLVRQWDSEQAVDAIHEFNKEGVKSRCARGPSWRSSGTPVEHQDAGAGRQAGSPAPVTEEVEFKTDELLVDMSGAEFMPGPTGAGVANAKKLRAPAEMLFLQPNGELVIREMADEAEDYQRLYERY